MLELKKQLELAKKLSLIAGKEILKYYDTLKTDDVSYKKDNSPLTIADKKSNEIIVNSLKSNFPDYAILAEETEDNLDRLNYDWCWIIDPLDGTKEFIKKNGEFTVNIGLAYKHNVVLGVVYSPTTEELYYASKGNGTYLEKNNEIKKIKVSDKIDKIRLVKSRSHSGPEMDAIIEKNKNKIIEIKDSGSSIKGCLVAKGEAEVYYRLKPTMEWDSAAMQCVVEEAGGILKQLDGSDLLYNRKNPVNEKGFYAINNIKNKLIL